MNEKQVFVDTIIDFVTGKPVPDEGAEANRQAVERFLVETCGYAKEEISVSVEMNLTIGGEPYRSAADLVITCSEGRIMLVKCAAGSLGSCEREAMATARLLDPEAQIPITVVSDGNTALVFDTVSGKKTGEGMAAIPTRTDAKRIGKETTPTPLPERRREKEALIFRTYDMINVHRRGSGS